MDGWKKLQKLIAAERHQNLGEIDLVEILSDEDVCERIRLKHDLCAPDDADSSAPYCLACGKTMKGDDNEQS